MNSTRPKGPSAPPPKRTASVAPAKRPSVAPPKRPPLGSVDRRCPVHGLALSPDGRCMRCNTNPLANRPGLEPLLEPTSLRTKLLVALVVACLLGAAMVLASQDDAAPIARGLVVERGAEPQAAPPPPAPDPAVAAAQRESERRAREAAARTAAQAATEAQQQREAQARARAHVPIVLYGTAWCGACRQARSYLLGQGIPFRDLDVEADPAARAAYVRLNPAQTVPTLTVGGRVLRGFSPEAFERALDDALASAQ